MAVRVGSIPSAERNPDTTYRPLMRAKAPNMLQTYTKLAPMATGRKSLSSRAKSRSTHQNDDVSGRFWNTFADGNETDYPQSRSDTLLESRRALVAITQWI